MRVGWGWRWRGVTSSVEARELTVPLRCLRRPAHLTPTPRLPVCSRQCCHAHARPSKCAMPVHAHQSAMRVSSGVLSFSISRATVGSRGSMAGKARAPRLLASDPISSCTASSASSSISCSSCRAKGCMERAVRATMHTAVPLSSCVLQSRPNPSAPHSHPHPSPAALPSRRRQSPRAPSSAAAPCAAPPPRQRPPGGSAPAGGGPPRAAAAPQCPGCSRQPGACPPCGRVAGARRGATHGWRSQIRRYQIWLK